MSHSTSPPNAPTTVSQTAAGLNTIHPTPPVSHTLPVNPASTSTTELPPTIPSQDPQAHMRGLKTGKPPSCFAGLKPEFRGMAFGSIDGFKVNGVPASSLEDLLRSLQGIETPHPTGQPTNTHQNPVSSSPDIDSSSDGSDSIDHPD
jgi:hypothetical protein